MSYNDIKTHDIDDNSKFSNAWMCPIHKKNDKHDIANYCPITVLNIDYKLMTKALQVKLALIAPHLINSDQAGFMKNRSIIDHIKTIRMMTDHAETTPGNDRIIITLDQEKVYDKIKHDYLWKVLGKMNLPTTFINTVKNLYK